MIYLFVFFFHCIKMESNVLDYGETYINKNAFHKKKIQLVLM